MRYGLLALSVFLLGGGGFAAQSAWAITIHATAAIAETPRTAPAEVSGKYGSLPFTSIATR